MLFYLLNRNKTIKKLRRKMKYTAKDLAIRLKRDTTFVLKIENKKLKDIDPKLRDKIIKSLK